LPCVNQSVHLMNYRFVLKVVDWPQNWPRRGGLKRRENQLFALMSATRKGAGSVICPRCGHENPKEHKFCSECDASLLVRCPACGTDCPPGAKFCGQCGAVFLRDTSAPAVVPRPELSVAPTPTSFVSGRYEVQRFLGEGGKKKVYLATTPSWPATSPSLSSGRRATWHPACERPRPHTLENVWIPKEESVCRASRDAFSHFRIQSVNDLLEAQRQGAGTCGGQTQTEVVS